LRHGKAVRVGGLEVDHQLEFGRLLNWQIGRLGAFEDLFASRRDQLIALASRYAVPAMCESRQFAVAGGLGSYGPSVDSVIAEFGFTSRARLHGCLSPGWHLRREASTCLIGPGRLYAVQGRKGDRAAWDSARWT
jgi:hypothetical protein